MICVDSAYSLTYDVEGLADGEHLQVEVTLHAEATVGAAGDYEITAGGAATSDNYSITYASGTLTVRDHAYQGAVTTVPGCNASGEMTYTCSHNSAHTYTEPIPADENAHAWTEGVVTTEPTCSAPGTKTFTCAHNSKHTKTEEMAIDENMHAWNEGVVTTEPTCSAPGTKTFTCAHDGKHIRTEEVAALGHEYDNGCDGDCNVCAELRTPAEHVDAEQDGICDACAAELPRNGLPGGVIAAIVAAAVVAAGLGGFALYRFVIKKKNKAVL